MKAKTLKGFQKVIRGQERIVHPGELLDVHRDDDRDSGEIRLNGEYLCDATSPFACEHFKLIDELEVVELPGEPDAERLKRLQHQGYTNLPYDDVAWLIAQAEKVPEYEKWLTQISEIDTDAFTVADASYWSLIALGKA